MSFPIPLPAPSFSDIVSFLKKPKLLAFVPDDEPNIQRINKQQRAVYRIGVVNVGDTPIRNARIYLNFDGDKRIIIPIKWDSKAEPFDTYKTLNIVPWLLVDSKIQDILPAFKETFAVLIKYDGENECYPFSANSYLHPDLKEERNKLENGEYSVKAVLISETYRCSFSFNVKNIGKSFNDVSIEPLKDYRGNKIYKPIKWE